MCTHTQCITVQCDDTPIHSILFHISHLPIGSHSFPRIYPSTDLLSDGDSNEAGGGSLSSSDVTDTYSLEESDRETETGNGGATSCPERITSCTEIYFWYIDPDGTVVCTKDEAAVTFNGESNFCQPHPVFFIMIC